MLAVASVRLVIPKKFFTLESWTDLEVGIVGVVGNFLKIQGFGISRVGGKFLLS